MASVTRALTPSGTSPFTAAAGAPDTPTSLTSQPTSAHTLAPIATVAAGLRASSSPKSHKALSPRLSPLPLTGAAALEDQRKLREQQERAAAGTRTSPNPNVAAISSILAQSSAHMAPLNPGPPEQIAQMAQKIEIPENGNHDTTQTSPVSMSSVGSLETTTAANASTSAPILAPSMPAPAENPFPDSDPHAPRPAVDAGVSGDSRAFTFPPPPGEDPRNPHRNASLPNAGISSPRASATKRHKCPYCSTVFTRHHNLKSHLLTHSQEKPYECQQCQSRFRRLHDLKRHTKLHTGERPHECPKCGRKFARGDALARHNKGQGGCAGRRSSFGIDPDDAEGRGEHMSGIEYTAEPDQMDEEGDLRRGSEPSRERQNSGAYRAGPSTYPPPAIGPGVRPGGIAPMYPPSGPPSQRETSSPHQPGLSSIPHFPPAGSGVFQGVTESPKPLSPGQPNPYRGSASSSSGHAFPSNRGSGPQLPPLPPIQHGSMPPPSGSQPGSLSSGGSVGSTREILGQRDSEWRPAWEVDQRLSKMQEDHLANLARIQSDRSRSEAALNAKISELENENRTLKDSQITQDTQIKRLREELATLKAKQEAVAAA